MRIKLVVGRWSLVVGKSLLGMANDERSTTNA
jgi:hypothetical protein